MIQSIAVFCGSALGTDDIYVTHAKQVGQAIAEQGKTLVYGGGRSGLMGVVADSALQAGGRVIGVIPKALVDREFAHPNLTELHIVEDMHQRKTLMADLSDAFLAMPGGAGTLEEIFEQWTWAQLGIHHKAIAFLNVAGFYDDLLKFIALTTEKGFTQPRFNEALMSADQIEDILAKLNTYQAPAPKWTVDNTQLVSAP